jgi:hypothetical protein
MMSPAIFNVIVREGGRFSMRQSVSIHGRSIGDYWMPRLRGA